MIWIDQANLYPVLRHFYLPIYFFFDGQESPQISFSFRFRHTMIAREFQYIFILGRLRALPKFVVDGLLCILSRETIIFISVFTGVVIAGLSTTFQRSPRPYASRLTVEHATQCCYNSALTYFQRRVMKQYVGSSAIVFKYICCFFDG